MLTSFRTVRVALVAAAALLLLASSAFADYCPTYTGKPKGNDGQTMTRLCEFRDPDDPQNYNHYCDWNLNGVSGFSYWYPKNKYPYCNMTFKGNGVYDAVIKVFFANTESVMVVVPKNVGDGAGCDIDKRNIDADHVIIWKA